jgi:hypothetical protein
MGYIISEKAARRTNLSIAAGLDVFPLDGDGLDGSKACTTLTLPLSMESLPDVARLTEFPWEH